MMGILPTSVFLAVVCEGSGLDLMEWDLLTRTRTNTLSATFPGHSESKPESGRQLWAG